MTEVIDAYWSFRSPYSYLITPDLLRLRRDYDIDVQMRIVYPIAIRKPELLFNTDSRLKPQYIIRDSYRRAEYLGMPLAPARPDPVVQDFATMAISDTQPFIHRLSALGVEAQRRGRGVEFVANVSALIFGGTNNWDQEDHLQNVVAAAGLNLDELETAIEGGDQLKEVEDNQLALDAAGHWGVPTLVVRGEPFFGQDRVDTLRWRLDRLGLARD